MQRDIADLGLDKPFTGKSPASTEALVDALGAAHSTFTLYEDPRHQEAFERAVATLGRAPAYPWQLEVSIDGFAKDGEPVEIRREGSVRLARGLFGLGVAALELVAPPQADDLLDMLRLCVYGAEAEDPADLLRNREPTSIRLLDRLMLLAGDSSGGDDGPPVTSTLGLAEDSPTAFIRGMLAEDDDPRSVARRFVEEYVRSHLLSELDDTWGIEELIHAFVDGFWYLPEAHRAEIFSLMLPRGHRDENVAVLDQFGGMELAQMSRMFGEGGHPLLTEYLRVAGEEGGRNPGDDVGGLAAGTGEVSLTGLIVDQVAAVLRARDASGPSARETAIDRLTADHPTDADRRASTTNLLRGLLVLSAGTDRFHATAATWASRVVVALAEGDLEAADEWIEAIAELDLGDESHRRATAALASVLRGDAVDTIARLLTAPPPDGPGAACRKAAPMFAADGLVAELGDEQNPGRRKDLVKALQMIAHLRPQEVVDHLDDERWFVVRNVAIALGTSQRPDVCARLAELGGHSDHRVRLEALRATYRLKGDDALDVLLEHLRDGHGAVAAEAGRLLGGIRHPDVDRRLIEATDSDDLAEAGAAVTALAARTSREATAAVQQIARRRFAVGRRRRLRAAARRALEGQP